MLIRTNSAFSGFTWLSASPVDMQLKPRIEWQPGYEGILPWEAKFCALYLLAVLIISFVKWASLTRPLWWPAIGRHDWPGEKAGEDDRARRLALSAIAGRFSTDSAAEDPTSASLQVLERANASFQYLCGIAAAKVASTRRLAPLTILVAVFVLLISTIRILIQISLQKSAGIAFVTESITLPLMQFAFGILVSAVLYCVSGFYEGVLMRRRASWSYFYASAQSQVSSERD